MILSNITDNLIYSDSDVIFLKPINYLWQHLKTFNEHQLAAIAPTTSHPLSVSEDNENFIPHVSGAFQINSGVSTLLHFLFYAGYLYIFVVENSYLFFSGIIKGFFQTTFFLETGKQVWI